MDKKSEKHNKAMQKQKERVSATMAKATQDQSVVVLLTGNGKGKTSSAFGMAIRALGYGQQVAIIQFIKGVQKSGEELFFLEQLKDVPLYQMGTGFTWDTQDRDGDMAAAKITWNHAKNALSSPKYDLVILDELTYMLSYQYLDEQSVVDAIIARPSHQNVVITGRGGGSRLREIADTVSEIKEIKHAYNQGIMAKKGIDF